MPFIPTPKQPPPQDSTQSSSLSHYQDFIIHLDSSVQTYPHLFPASKNHSSPQLINSQFSSQIYPHLKHTQQTHQFNINTLCVALHFYSYIHMNHYDHIPQKQNILYAETCLMLAALTFENLRSAEELRKYQLYDNGSEREEKVLKWLKFKLNPVSFVSYLSPLESILKINSKISPTLLRNIEALTIKAVDRLEFLQEHPKATAMAIIKQAGMLSDLQWECCPFPPSILNENEWKEIKSKQRVKNIKRQQNFLLKKVNFPTFKPSTINKQFFKPIAIELG